MDDLQMKKLLNSKRYSPIFQVIFPNDFLMSGPSMYDQPPNSEGVEKIGMQVNKYIKTVEKQVEEKIKTFVESQQNYLSSVKQRADIDKQAYIRLLTRAKMTQTQKKDSSKIIDDLEKTKLSLEEISNNTMPKSPSVPMPIINVPSISDDFGSMSIEEKFTRNFQGESESLFNMDEDHKDVLNPLAKERLRGASENDSESDDELVECERQERIEKMRNYNRMSTGDVAKSVPIDINFGPDRMMHHRLETDPEVCV